jgi:hypothetical protein
MFKRTSGCFFVCLGRRSHKTTLVTRNTPSKIEQLPVEILLIIFQYLEAHDLVNAFGNFNSYFRSVLASSHLRVHANINISDVKNKLLTKSIWSILTPQSIYSITTQNTTHDALAQFVQCYARRLIHLTSLTLDIDKDRFEHIVHALPHLIGLKRLSLKQMWPKYDGKNKHSLLSAILRMKSLRVCIVNEDFVGNIRENLIISNSIKGLRIDSMASASSVLVILRYTPNLSVLHLQFFTWKEFFPLTHDSFIHNQLTVIKIDRWVSDYHNFERLVRTAPSLRCLRILYWGMHNAEEQNQLFNQNLFKKLLENIADVQIDIVFYVHPHEETEEIRTRLQMCSWLTLTTSFYDYLDAETVFEIVFKQLK